MRSFLRGLGLTVVALMLAACAATQVRYYSLANPVLPSVTPLPTGASIHFEMAPVGVPERLARPQMVVRNDADPSSTSVRVLEQQRWTSSFDSELRDAFGVAIAARLGAVDVSRGGHLPGHPVYRVAVQVRQFDATLDKEVDARFGWTITRSDDDRNAVCQTTATQKVGLGIDELVQGIQRVVATTADHIAAQIAALQDARTLPCPSPISAGKTPRNGPDTTTSTDPRRPALHWSAAPA